MLGPKSENVQVVGLEKPVLLYVSVLAAGSIAAIVGLACASEAWPLWRVSVVVGAALAATDATFGNYFKVLIKHEDPEAIQWLKFSGRLLEQNLSFGAVSLITVLVLTPCWILWIFHLSRNDL